mmetsp:Transcript_2995/g.3210  ORF Transcript_2995/g.3210 Transcript_2995/m.3210 type:complete len:364 (+) Transcript_2995:104-1195(+)|eukprot:CAMPEP_0114997662 /NCGR_PEP_ID=MMETSP0216-20121206/15031_1 /TAXON_ID=223996 /ORGANISM="Protocruzia adherens, Strain Boccale" /LENGTH=363 /DNA_ID=CAMNT_0002362083 /DNA_START=145 /DNA_END=1236 /DNA_ORIENTATION=+
MSTAQLLGEYKRAKQPEDNQNATVSNTPSTTFSGAEVSEPPRKDSSHAQNVKFWYGVGFQVLASTMFAINFMCVKVAHQAYNLGNNQILFYRSIVTLSYAGGFMFINKIPISHGLPYKWPLLTRSIVAALVLYLNYISIDHLDLYVVSALGHTAPLFGVIFGVIWFKEKLTQGQALALLVASAGVWLITMPLSHGQKWSIFLMFPLFAGLLRAMSRAVVKACKGIQWILPVLAAGVVVFVSSGIGMAIEGSYVPLDWGSFFLLMGLGVAGTLGNAFMVRATLVAELGLTMSISYIGVVLNFLADSFLFHAVITWNEVLGGVAIFTGLLILTFLKYKAAMKKKAAQSLAQSFLNGDASSKKEDP